MKEILFTKIVISSIAAAFFIVHSCWPDLLNLDPISLGALSIAVLPWLSGVIKAVKLPFFEIELQEARKDAATAKAAAESARQQANAALMQPEPRGENPEELVKLYNATREAMGPSYARTNKLTKVVSRMITAALALPEFEWKTRILDADRGWRLFAIVWNYTNPKAENFEELLKAVFDHFEDNQHFGQYWSILALQNLAASTEKIELTEISRSRLLKMDAKTDSESDRKYELERLFQELGIG